MKADVDGSGLMLHPGFEWTFLVFGKGYQHEGLSSSVPLSPPTTKTCWKYLKLGPNRIRA